MLKTMRLKQQYLLINFYSKSSSEWVYSGNRLTRALVRLMLENQFSTTKKKCGMQGIVRSLSDSKIKF